VSEGQHYSIMISLRLFCFVIGHISNNVLILSPEGMGFFFEIVIALQNPGLNQSGIGF
jgi:hypothetical protein